MKKLITLIFSILLIQIYSSSSSFAQLTTTTGASAASIASTLSGLGITVNNVQIRCGSTQYATFTSTGTTGLGISKGLLLTTGTAVNVGSNSNTFLSADVPNGVNPVGFSNVGAQFPVLASILPAASSVNDACEISFNLIPNCNLINLNYVFASDEYPTFSANSCPPVSNSIYDIFAFVISGPNPSGGNYTNQNLALVPGTSQPVTIHSVSPYCNAGYYVDNTSGTSIAYDGYTTPFTAAIDVVPCKTYTMKLQIADGGDAIYDSGVFIEYQSFACASSAITSSPNKIICPSQATTITATKASSYTWLTSPATPITYINDSIIVIAPSVTTTVTINGYSGCSPSTQTLSTKNVIITVNPPTNINFDAAYTKNSTCGYDNGRFRVSLLSNAVTGGYTPYTYDFNNSGVFSPNKTFTGLFAGTYTITVKDSKGCTFSKNYALTDTPGITSYTKTIDSATCSLSNGKINITSVIGGTAPYTYTFNSTAITTVNSITGLSANNNYKIKITDANGCEFIDSVKIKNFPSPEKVYLSSFTDTCSLAKGKVVVDSVKLGTPPFRFYFNSTTTSTTNTFAINLIASNAYIVKVVDANDCSRQDTIRIENIAPPIINAGQSQSLCIGKEIVLNGEILQGATNAIWETNGLGIIENPNALNTKYISTILEQQQGSQILFTLKSINHFYACQQAVSTNTVKIETTPIASFTSDSIKFCLPFYAKINNYSVVDNGSFKWYIDDTLVSTDKILNYEITNQGKYAVSLVATSKAGCKDSIRVANKIIAIKQPKSIFYLETTIPTVNELTTFFNSSTNADSYKWNFGDNANIVSAQNTEHIYEIADEYEVTLIANEQTNFCSDTSTINIIVNPSIRVYIPATFTPNGDGLNDVFSIVGQGMKNIEIKIFNRWGNIVFSASDTNITWDGKISGEIVPDGVYIYKLKVTDIKDIEYNYRGTLTIIK